MNIKDKYAIVGIGYTPQGRIEDRTVLSFHTEACANAIIDAGLERKDIDGLMCYRQFPPGPNEEEIPYVTAIIELDEGPHFLSNIVGCDPDTVYCDMPVELIWEDVDQGFSLPKFKPVSVPPNP